MTSRKQIAKRAYIAGIYRGQKTSPRTAYHKGYKSGYARADRLWTKKAAEQSHYYYKMGRGSK